MGIVQEWPQFGPWIAFKAADMLERCAGSSLTFPHDLGVIYKEPREALDILSETEGATPTDGRSPYVIWEDLLAYFADWKAPPDRAGGEFRACGVQEVETVLCKWKSHRNGHYRVGKDIREVREALHGWGATAERMLAAMPAEV